MTEPPTPTVNAQPEARPSDPQTVTIPLGMLYGSDLPQTVRFTWLQLFGLACRLPDGHLQTPPLRLKEIAHITGKSASALYNQLAVLRSVGLVHQHSLNDSRIILSFAGSDAAPATDSAPAPADRSAVLDDAAAAPHIGPAVADAMAQDQPAALPDGPVESPTGIPEDAQDARDVSSFRDSRFLESGFYDSRFQETEISPSLKYLKDKKNHLIKIKKREGKLLDSRFQESGKADAESSSRHSPIAVYHELTGLHLNKVQRKMLLDQVGDLQLWRESVTHWLGHHWNPFNIPGMLDLYRRGGPDECTFCSPLRNQSTAPGTPDGPVADPIENLRRRHGLA